MRIRFLHDTYIRQAPRVGGESPIGVVYKGAEITVLPEPIPGDIISNNNLWYCDHRGWYFWSGATQVIETYPLMQTERSVAYPADSITKPKPQKRILNWPEKEEPSSSQSENDPNNQPTGSSPISETTTHEEVNIPSMRNPLAQIWENPPKNKLNWPIRTYAIAKNWWQDKRLTGKQVRLAILSTGYTPQHPDLPQIGGFFEVPGRDPQGGS